MPTYYTYANKVPLKPGDTLSFAAGKGYYAAPAPTAASKPAASSSFYVPSPGYTPKANDPLYGAGGAYDKAQQTYIAANPAVVAAGAAANASSGGGGSSANADAVPAPEITDWASYLGLFGLDAEALAAINSVKRTGNISVDSANIMNALRQTQWYAKTYPGIGEAIARGIVTNEADYRQKKNEFDQIYQQNFGRAIGNEEYAQFLKQGLSSDIVNRQIQGDKYIAANRNDIQYNAGNFGDTGQYSDSQLQEVGRNKAGLGTQNGVNLQAQLDKAIARAQRVFQGTLAGMQIQPTQQTGAPAPSNQYPDIGR